MLTKLTEGLRVRAAIILAVAYALCVMFPPIAFAFADGALAAHCLAVDHHGATHTHGNGHATTHVHGDGTVHTHAGDAGSINSDDGQPSKHMGSCCGLFCFVAVTTEFHVVGGSLVVASAAHPACDENLAGREPGRIDRPPSTPFMSS
jgi:hypothetical protein